MKQIKSQSGTSLIQVLVSSAILTILISLMATWMNQQNKEIYNLRLTGTRDQLKEHLDRYAANSAILAFSAGDRGPNSSGNLALDYCMNGAANPPLSSLPSYCVGSNCCIDNTSSASAPQYFNLEDPTVPARTVLFAGTDAESSTVGTTTYSPARFDSYGNTCTTPSAACPFELYTSFIANCGGSPNCQKAASLSVKYEIRIAPNINLATPLRKIASYVLPLSSPGSSSQGGGQVFKTSGTFNVPAGVTKLTVEVWGAGGGGGMSGGGTTEGAGGGGGGYAKGIVLLSSGTTTIPVTIGQGGIGGDWFNNNSGTAGGPSFFGGSYSTAWLHADGGQGGSISSTGYYQQAVAGGAGGGAGGTAAYLTSSGAQGGTADASGLNGGAAAYNGAGGAPGMPFTSVGSGGTGGGGDCSSGWYCVGGAGQSGAVIVTW